MPAEGGRARTRTAGGQVPRQQGWAVAEAGPEASSSAVALLPLSAQFLLAVNLTSARLFPTCKMGLLTLLTCACAWCLLSGGSHHQHCTELKMTAPWTLTLNCLSPIPSAPVLNVAAPLLSWNPYLQKTSLPACHHLQEAPLAWHSTELYLNVQTAKDTVPSKRGKGPEDGGRRP